MSDNDSKKKFNIQSMYEFNKGKKTETEIKSIFYLPRAPFKQTNKNKKNHTDSM